MFTQGIFLTFFLANGHQRTKWVEWLGRKGSCFAFSTHSCSKLASVREFAPPNLPFRLTVQHTFLAMGRCSTFVKQQPMAGTEGVEPSISCSRGRRLTAWLRPIVINKKLLTLLRIFLSPSPEKSQKTCIF